MDKTLGVIGLIAVAAIIFVLSIDDQTPPVATHNDKVNRQKIEAKTSAPVSDLASKAPFPASRLIWLSRVHRCLLSEMRPGTRLWSISGNS